MGRKKKIDEVKEVLEGQEDKIIEASADGVITPEELEDIAGGEGSDSEDVKVDDVAGDGEGDEVVPDAGQVPVSDEPIDETDEVKEDTPVADSEDKTDEPGDRGNGEDQNNEGDLVDNSGIDPKASVLPVEVDDEKKPSVDPEDTPASKYEKGVNLLNDTKATVAEKIEWCLAVGPGKVRTIALQLNAYNDAMKPGVVHDESKMVGKQYELVSIFRTAFKAETYTEFKARFDVINLFFQHFADEAFASHSLVRFDYLWKWSAKELETLQNVTEVISQLSNAKTRKANLKKLNLEMALDSEKTIVTEEARNNIIRYYSK